VSAFPGSAQLRPNVQDGKQWTEDDKVLQAMFVNDSFKKECLYTVCI